MAVWTHGRWTVEPGREEDFLAALGAVVEEVATEMEGTPIVLRDRDRPNLFLTFGRWASIEEVERFRALAAPRLEAMRDLLEDIEIFTLDEVGEG